MFILWCHITFLVKDGDAYLRLLNYATDVVVGLIFLPVQSSHSGVKIYDRLESWCAFGLFLNLSLVGQDAFFRLLDLGVILCGILSKFWMRMMLISCCWILRWVIIYGI